MRTIWRFAFIVLAGCGPANAGTSTPQTCAPAEGLETAVSAKNLAGEYHLRLVATTGSKRGGTSEGRLLLMHQDSSDVHLESAGGLRDTTYSLPYYGSVRVDFASVGAVVPGDPESEDPKAPGVLVIERQGGVMLRVGSEANRRGVRRFDGAFTALQVQRVIDRGFAGTWRSGVVGPESSGHFCADRVS